VKRTRLAHLTPDQCRALARSKDQRLYVVNPNTQTEYVLVPVSEYQAASGRRDELSNDDDAQLWKVPPKLAESRRAFTAALPGLLMQKRLLGKWVAFHGNQRVGFANSKAALFRRCERLGLSERQFYIGLVMPQPIEDEEIDRSWYELDDAPRE
jgi:hypothetical protein